MQLISEFGTRRARYCKTSIQWKLPTGEVGGALRIPPKNAKMGNRNGKVTRFGNTQLVLGSQLNIRALRQLQSGSQMAIPAATFKKTPSATVLDMAEQLTDLGPWGYDETIFQPQHHPRTNLWPDNVAKTVLRRHFEFGNVYFLRMNLSSPCSFNMKTSGPRLIAGAGSD